ncbi:MAG: hypothetical protein SGJ16_08770 [Nitrospirota bacterium]|nr:hypothetical protein [Nitrospirota bacterium]
MARAEEKVQQFVLLADDVLAVRRTIDKKLETAIHNGTFQCSMRNRVLVGLSIKSLDSFDRLLDDARERRGECSHHLKTMAESFIYSGWVSMDTGEANAKVLCADGFRSRVAYHKALGETDLATDYERLRRQEIEHLQTEWRKFQQTNLEALSNIANRTDHYHQVYRMACEAAHLGDLTVYMPPQPTEIGYRLSDLSLLRTFVCLKFGIILACDLLHDASDALGLRLDVQLHGFRERWKAIIGLGSPSIDT